MPAALAMLVLLAGSASAQQAWPRATTADDGLRVWHFENSSETFRVVALVGYGSRMDPDSEAGAAHLLQQVLLHGSATRSAKVLDAELGEHEGSLRSLLSKETLEFSISVPVAYWKVAVRQLGERVTKPRFFREEIERERDTIVRETASVDVAADPIDGILFAGSSLGRSALDHRGVATLSKQRLEQIHARWFRPKNMIVAFAGAVPHDACVELIDGSFVCRAQYTGGELPEPATPLVGRHPLDVSPYPRSRAAEFLVIGFHVRAHGRDALLGLLALRAIFERGLDKALRGVSFARQAVEVRTYSDAWRIQWVVGPERTGMLSKCESAFDRIAQRVRDGKLSDQELELAKSDVGVFLDIETDDDLHRVVRWLDVIDDELVGVPDLKLASLHIPTSAIEACVAGDEFVLAYRSAARWPHVLLASILFVIVVGDGLAGFPGARKVWTRITSFLRERRGAAARSKGDSDTLTLEIREFFDKQDKGEQPRDED